MAKSRPNLSKFAVSPNNCVNRTTQLSISSYFTTTEAEKRSLSEIQQFQPEEDEKNTEYLVGDILKKCKGVVEPSQEILVIKSPQICEDKDFILENSIVYKEMEISINPLQKLSPTIVKGNVWENVDPSKLTPLEKQFVKFKKKYFDAVLFVECGYKYRFFAEDAEIAAKELNIMCRQDHNFMSASIPSHRLNVHVQRLVELNYKVGVVQQIETAAIKAKSTDKNKLFSRELTALYTKGTLIGEVLGQGNTDLSKGPDNGSYFMCLYEKEVKDQQDEVLFGCVAVNFHTGDVIYDNFKDFLTRNELQTRIAHLDPCEFLISEKTSRRTRSFLSTFSRQKNFRVETQPESLFEYSTAFPCVTRFFSNASTNAAKLEELTNLNYLILSCLGALIQYLTIFKLGRIFLYSNLKKFQEAQVLYLNGTTVSNLELFCNQFDGLEFGSLFWVINKTRSVIGRRKLKQWMCRPLASSYEINKRLDAIEKLRECKYLESLKELLLRVPDIERGLTRIYHSKSSCAEFCSILNGFDDVISVFEKFISIRDNQYLLSSDLLYWIFADDLQHISTLINQLYTKIDQQAAREGNYNNIFNENYFPEIKALKKKIIDCVEKINELREPIMKALGISSFEYVTVSGQEFLIEVKNSRLSFTNIPSDWIKVGGTKHASRYQSPPLIELVDELAALREELSLKAKLLWADFLQQFSSHYDTFHELVRKVSVLDCLISLTEVSIQNDYTRPIFTALDSSLPFLDIKAARHPMISLLIHDQFVPNDVKVQPSCGILITGPNMGGKSSFMRMAALIVILAQIGSYVPASYAELGIFDSIFTRMGAHDEIHKGLSTFMVEMQETSEILQKATNRSLVILDELGRGTSTHDGIAIAYSTLYFLAQKKNCIFFFATHYLSLARFEKIFPNKIYNYHTEYLESPENTELNEFNKIVFLYRVVPKVAKGSYGLHVAKLAGINDIILRTAARKSKEMKQKVESVNESKKENEIKFRQIMKIVKNCKE